MKKVLLCCLLVSICDVRSMNRKIPSVVNFMEKEVGMYNPLLGHNIYLNFVEPKTTSAEVAVDWALTYFPGLSREELFGWPVFYKKDVQISKTPLDNGGFILSNPNNGLKVLKKQRKRLNSKEKLIFITEDSHEERYHRTILLGR